MTVFTDVTTVDLATLRNLEFIAEGGQARIFAVGSAPTGLGHVDALVFKQYTAAARTMLDPVALCTMLRLPSTLAPEGRRFLSEATAWPLALVLDGDTVCGFLARRAPRGFHIAMAIRAHGAVLRPAGVEFLLNASGYLRRIGLDVSDQDRMRVLAGVARGLMMLHRLGVVVGDMSPRNVLYDGHGGAFFLDCDSMSVDGRTALPPLQTVDWRVVGPAGDIPTPEADHIKLALLAVRLAAGHQSTRDPTALGRFSTGLAALANRALTQEAGADVPSAEEWLSAAELSTRSPSLHRSTVVSRLSGLLQQGSRAARRISRRSRILVVASISGIALAVFPALQFIHQAESRAPVPSVRVGVVQVRVEDEVHSVMPVAGFIDRFVASVDAKDGASLRMFDDSDTVLAFSSLVERGGRGQVSLVDVSLSPGEFVAKIKVEGAEERPVDCRIVYATLYFLDETEPLRGRRIKSWCR
jgi:hypothetical protein